MAPLRFRAWDNKNKKMYGPFTLEQILLGDPEKIMSLVEFQSFREDGYWMQSTGLKDKTGKEIFEGDIICWHHGCCVHCGEKANELIEKVCLDSVQGASVMSQPIWNHLENIEVIGNIHENPEPLEGD